MGKINTFKKLWKNNKRGIFIAVYNYVAHSGIMNILNDKLYLSITYRIKIGQKLDLDNPQTFNEKLQWLKLYDRNPKYIDLVDKVKVKEYVEKTIGKEYVIPTIAVWDTADDIDFNILPARFVLKCTHDSGSAIICDNKNKLNKNYVKKKLNRALKRKSFYWGREWPYKNVNPLIIAEENIADDKSELLDYKLMCFNGKVKCSFVCSERYSMDGLKVTFFDEKWNELPFERHYPKSQKAIQCPHNYEKMIELAEKLSKDIPFVRVDFYEKKEQIYFGEMTFFPGSGFEEFRPDLWDRILGEWIKIPEDLSI